MNWGEEDLEIEIGRVNIDEAQTIQQLQKECFEEDFKKYGECPPYSENVEKLIKKINEDIFYKVSIDNKIVGAIQLYDRHDEHFHLNMICIHPDYQNYSIGTKLIEFVEKQYPNLELWTLITPEKSFRNHYFYEKMGYKKVGEIIKSDCLTLWEYEKRNK